MNKSCKNCEKKKKKNNNNNNNNNNNHNNHNNKNNNNNNFYALYSTSTVLIMFGLTCASLVHSSTVLMAPRGDPDPAPDPAPDSLISLRTWLHSFAATPNLLTSRRT